MAQHLWLETSGRGPHEAARGEASMPSRGRSVAVEVWWPPACDRPLPVIAFGHGWRQPVHRYSGLLGALASWGLMVVAPRSWTGTFPRHEGLAGDLASALVWAAGHDTLVGGPWQGRLAADRLGLCGHSMGGGAAVLAAATMPRLGALATVDAAQTRPSAVAAAPAVRAPSLFVAGSDDRIAPLERHQRPIAAACPPPVVLAVVQGAGHRAAMDAGPPAQRAVHVRLLASWFRYHLLDEHELAPEVWGRAALPGVGYEARGGPAG